MSDKLISQRALEDAMYHEAFETDTDMQRWDSGCWIRYKLFENVIENLPAAQPEITAMGPKEIGYAECANTMLKMWIDNVLTDGEYNRIMDKLNKHWGIGERKGE